MCSANGVMHICLCIVRLTFVNNFALITPGLNQTMSFELKEFFLELVSFPIFKYIGHQLRHELCTFSPETCKVVAIS